ncbi:hypothetical protein [Nocardioides sp. B-3]|uniref:hypothetical protein n=1 Tax=Nocardioides sp. B-3 TaxID=2895565 RepID=UPI0021535980|nr:hypothetical protein [Nocardioides sp. B-3]UUZ60174.1 hypothetical protein LP418_04315 [Nocardioides sp. B-3]
MAHGSTARSTEVSHATYRSWPCDTSWLNPASASAGEFPAPQDIVVLDGVPITRSVRSVAFEMRYASSLGDAIVAMDMACFSDPVSIAEVTEHLADIGPVTGVQQARDAVAQAEENSWSPRETGMRGVWTRMAGLPQPLCNVPVFTPDGRHVGTPDVIDPVLGLLAQYNGSLHVTADRVSRDWRKDGAYRDLGLETVTMVASDWADLEGFAARLRVAAQRARARTTPVLWTVEPPARWTSTTTVAQRRALADWQRERYLRYRHAA